VIQKEEKENTEALKLFPLRIPYQLKDNKRINENDEGFYKKKIVKLRETLKSIKDEITEETSIPTPLESLYTTSKKSAPIIYLRELTRLKEENNLLKTKLHENLEEGKNKWVCLSNKIKEFKGRSFGRKTNKSFAGRVEGSWGQTQKMLYKYINRSNSRGKSINDKSCTNCIKLLHRGLSTRDCLHHMPFTKGKN